MADIAQLFSCLSLTVGHAASRLLRWFRYTRYWEDMNDFATALLNSISNILSLLLLLFIFILIAALLGMQAFGGKFNGPLGVPRTNFDNFYQAALAVFQVISTAVCLGCCLSKHFMNNVALTSPR